MKLLLVSLLLAMRALTISAQTPAGSEPPPIKPGVPHDLAIWRAAHYSDVRYKLDLTLEKMSPVLKGTIEIKVNVAGTRTLLSASPASAGELPPIILDWRKLSGHERDSTISNVTINDSSASRATPADKATPRADAAAGTPASVRVPYEESNEHLIFRDGVVPGENVIKLDFTSPILTSGSAITRYIDKEDGSEYIYSLFVPSDASTAFPVFDQPDLKARFTLQLSFPSSWGPAISNTEVKSFLNYRCITSSAEKECSTVFTFQETKPISTYVLAFAAGPWQEFSAPGNGSVPGAVATGAVSPAQKKAPVAIAPGTDTSNPLATHIYVRKSQAAKFQPHAAEVFKLTRDGIKYLEDYFDFKFPWPKYDLVLIPEFPFGGMEHAGATFLSERGVIFPSEPTANDYISRANLIFHETAHQWFGDTVTMRWFDDLWLKEGFAEFMAYKTLEKTMPQYNAWKAFYERNKPAAYFTDSTRGTTPIYQPIDNLSAAKSAYGNIVYRKAPSFLRQAEFYLGPDKFQTAVRAFLKKHAFANATWQDLVSEFEAASGKEELGSWWASPWVTSRGMPIFDLKLVYQTPDKKFLTRITQRNSLKEETAWTEQIKILTIQDDGKRTIEDKALMPVNFERLKEVSAYVGYTDREPNLVFPNYQDYGYGIFLLDEKSRDYVLKNIQNEKDDFLRSMMWGSLWDSVREAELDPRQYVELAIKDLPTERDETITASVLNRVSTAMTYYLSEPPASAGGQKLSVRSTNWPAAYAAGSDKSLQSRLESMLIDRMRTAPTLGQRLTYYRALLNIASTENGRNVLKKILDGEFGSTGGNATVTERAPTPANTARSLTVASLPVKTKDKFDIVTRLAILSDPDAPKLLEDLEKTETSDDAKRYAYATHAAFATKENREKFWTDFTTNKDISESWIEAAMGPFNSPKHSDLSLPYLQRALAELPNLKRNRKIFFVNGWLGAFLGGQKSQEALDIVNKFLAENPNLDRDLRLKILENMDVIERAVKIRAKFSKA